MSCPQTRATLAWLHGDAPGDDQALHVATCAHCQALCEETESLLHAIAPIAPALHPQTLPPPRAPRRTLHWFGMVVAAAAAVLWFTLAPEATTSQPLVAPTPSPTLAMTTPYPDVDVGLDALDAEVLALSLDLEVL